MVKIDWAKASVATSTMVPAAAAPPLEPPNWVSMRALIASPMAGMKPTRLEAPSRIHRARRQAARVVSRATQRQAAAQSARATNWNRHTTRSRPQPMAWNVCTMAPAPACTASAAARAMPARNSSPAMTDLVIALLQRRSGRRSDRS